MTKTTPVHTAPASAGRTLAIGAPQATRRNLFGTMGAMLLLSAAEAGPAKATELDGELLDCCAKFQEANRAYVAANYDDTLTDEQSRSLADTRFDLLDRITALPARSPEGLAAKVGALRLAMHTDVPEMLANTFEDCAKAHEFLADSVCQDILGRVGP